MINARYRMLLALPLIAALSGQTDPTPQDAEAIAAEARSLVKTFVASMKPLLQRSVRAHGAAGAIEVCADTAPELTARLAADSGWEIRRVSPRPRNLATASPDAWETEAMARLAEQLQAGQPPGEANYGQWVDGRYRYMQAQVTEGLCLLCHGSNQVTPDVRVAIASRYPDDRATGFTLGELRGAISLRSPVMP